MAQLPTIASTANRRLLPQADLRVEGVTPASFGGAIGAGLQQIGQAGQEVGASLQAFQQAKQAEEDRLAEFDRQTQFVSFGSDQNTKLAEAARNLSGPAVDFTKSQAAQFDTDAAAFLEKVPERFKPAWQTNMAKLRSGVLSEALRTEFGQRDSYYKTTIGDTLGKLQNGAMSSPDKLDSWKAQGEQIIETSGLSAQDKLEWKTRWKGSVAVAAAQGDLQRDPEGAMARLGGIDHIVETSGGYAGGGATYAKGGPATLKGDVISFFERNGVPAPVARGIAAGIESESSGDHTAVNPNSKAFGLGQWLGSRKRDLVARYGANPTRQQQLEFLLYELKGGDHGGPSVLSAKDEGQAVDRYIRNFMRPGKDTETGIQRGMKALGYKVQQGEPGSEATIAARTIGTGEVDARYADIPLDARVQLIGAAEREINQREQEVARAQQQEHSSWLNGFLTELNDGKAGAADIEAARKAGRLTDFDEISRAQNIVEAREKKNTDINLFNNLASTPGFAWNPYDDKQKKAVDAAVEAQGGGAQAAFNVWQKTGILGKAGAVALRGSMVSTNPQTVAQGASYASNMLAKNPNAFAGVEGGDDIERNAMLFGHYVNDLGYSRDEAARRVAETNTPAMKSKIAMGQPEVAAFRKSVQRTSVASVLGKALDTTWFDGTPSFVAPEQKQAAGQDYADLASDHYSRFGDADAAKAYALGQMKKIYGVVNGRLMKYPPTRAYPEIEGSTGYIFQQAAKDIKAVTGRTVSPDKVYLMPVPTATAEAFRAGRAPPYEVHYIDEVDGQEVYRVLNGQVFHADPAAQTKRVQQQRKALFDKDRQIDRLRASDPYADERAAGRYGVPQ